MTFLNQSGTFNGLPWWPFSALFGATSTAVTGGSRAMPTHSSGLGRCRGSRAKIQATGLDFFKGIVPAQLLRERLSSSYIQIPWA
jgi:hypothetical protein